MRVLIALAATLAGAATAEPPTVEPAQPESVGATEATAVEPAQPESVGATEPVGVEATGPASSEATEPVSATTTEPVPVAIEATDDGWRLLRGGAPYSLRGVGGHHDLDLLAAIGGTTIRTWGVDEHTAALLDEAHARGLTVALGIWLGHERHGFDYDDPEQVARQLADVKRAVLAHRHHPALLLWGVGNEMEGFEQGDDPAVWSAVCAAARAVQELDPHHPVMTTTADIGGGRIAGVSGCAAIDVHGVNSYGGAPSLLQRYREGGGRKPVVLTEYGPPGSWEAARSPFGAPLEATSTAKAEAYGAVARAAQTEPQLLGAFAFLWGWKTEGSATWFGLFLPDGTRLGGVDALADAWGQPVPNRAPTGQPLSPAPGILEPGSQLEVRWLVQDPEGDPLSTTWTLRGELAAYETGGDTLPTPPAVGELLEASTTHASLRLPAVPGAYRLYAVARDDHGGGVTASLPLQVGAPVGPGPAPLPQWVYRDAGLPGLWTPSGFMGDAQAVRFQDDWADACASPPSCIRIELTGTAWAGIAWQHPPNNWGEGGAGVDLSGAKWLTFKVKGKRPETRATFGVGLVQGERHSDSLTVQREVDVPWQWETVRLRLRGDRSSVVTGFWLVLPPQRQAGTVLFVDDVAFR